MIAEGNEAISLLGLDMELWNYFSSLYDQMEFPSKSCHLTLKLDGYKFHTTTSHCDVFLANQNFVTNRFEFWASLRNLACNHAEATEQRFDYAKACKTYDDDDEFGKHGIEFRIYATRIDFKRLEEEYWVEFGVNVEIDRPEPYLDILNRTENYIKLFSIQLGNNGRNFAILTDEMNGNVYDYGSSVIANLEHKSIQEIIEEDGAIATIGPDMNLEGKLMFATNFEFLSVSKKVCTGTGDLKLNSELIEKELSCYKRPENQCDEFGLKEYNKMKESFNEYKELIEKCPCDREPRPPSITDDRLVVPPGVRDKRSLKNDPLLGTRDADGLVRGCQDATFIGFDDIEFHPNEIAYRIENQRECKF
uniref:Uncharacterized protein n=2 Tax=Meloidogyne TaxID=189290 RepID=A0A915M4Q4_MELJA